jgi:pimeloyl-ACP methyl ester carboxylesterase
VPRRRSRSATSSRRCCLRSTGRCGDRAEHAKANIERALAAGIAGWRDDDLAFVSPWGFEPADVRVPSLLWQGVQDLMVPVAHGRWLAERLPGVEAHISEEDGHLSIAVGRLGEIYDWLRKDRPTALRS